MPKTIVTKIMKIRDEIYHQHDVVCNQKYGDNLPYSFHLKAVESQGRRFIHLIPDKRVENKLNSFSSPESVARVVLLALSAHDLIEDGRMTYNDVKELGEKELGNSNAVTMFADIVYCVTDEKGKTRVERKSDKYYKELSENSLAVFVKLADIAANTLYSKLTGSSMYEKYKQEFPNMKSKLYKPEFKEFFNYVENL